MKRKKTDLEIIEYARSLISHGFYDNMNDAINESLRFFRKCDDGFMEPMKCPHRLGIETHIEMIDGKTKSVKYILKDRKTS